uniref:microtubule-associated protein 4-like isoform X6 n=1 Tax=Solea senegalensis TaxID=28829 RepID=UPI001CD91248|nr:microtubule-associated protein 4-like isoform X6 [Solea senegalensis]
MDLSLRDALGGGGGGVPGGAPAEAVLKRDFMASLEKEKYDDKVGETVTKSDYRPLIDGKDTKSGPGIMSSMMSSGGYQDKPGQPPFTSGNLSGFSQSALGGTMGSGVPPFQTSMSSNPFSQSGIGSAMDTQKTSGLFGVENKTTTNTSGSSPFKTSDPFSSSGPGIHTTDYSAAPVLSPSGSIDDISPSSSASDDSTERVGGEQRRRKKRRKSHDEVYDFLDSQEKNISQSEKGGQGGVDNEEEEEEEENWEWEIRESGVGGRVKGKKTKTRARLPKEWGAPQQPISPTPASIAPTWATPGPNSNPSPVLTSASAQIPTSFTNHSHASLLTDLSQRSYEPMCVDDFQDVPKATEVSNSKPEAGVSITAGATTAKAGSAGDAGRSLVLLTGENLSPVSQTFSFLDSVLQTPQCSTPESQTTTPITNTPYLATAPLTKSTPKEIVIPASDSFSVSKNLPLLTPASKTSTVPAAVGSALNVNAKPFVPAATSALPLGSAPAPPTSSSNAPLTSVATCLSSAPPITPKAPPSLPAHSEHQESSSPQLPPLEVKSDNKDKQEKMDLMSGKTEKIDAFDKKDKDEQQQKKDNTVDKNQKSDKILKDEEKIEKMNVEKNTANEKAEKVDKPEKTNKDEKKEEEKKPAEKMEEKGGKGPAKPLTGNGSKTLLSPDSKSKTPENGSAEKRPPVPKATPTPRAPANKNGSSAATASKAAANKNDKAESKTGDAKKPKTPARPRPASSTTPATPTPSTNGDSSAHRRRVITKPPVPKQVPLEKKPPVPRTNRTPRPINAPTPDLKNVRSKIGSIDNIKYQPGGGKVSSTQNNKTSDPSSATATAAKAKVQIVHKKLDFSHITSRCGSKDNIKHVPGGGNVQILSKKVDVSKVTSKCGSKDNIKYKPGGGDVKIESHKLNIKAKSKIGSMDNVGEQTNGHKEEKAEEKTSSPPSGAPATAPADVAKATAPAGVAKENGAKEAMPTPFGGDVLREPLSIDKRITETSGCK